MNVTGRYEFLSTLKGVLRGMIPQMDALAALARAKARSEVFKATMLDVRRNY